MSIAMSGAASGRLPMAVCGVSGVQFVTRPRVRVLVAISEARNGSSISSRYQMHPQSIRESDLANKIGIGYCQSGPGWRGGGSRE